MAYISFQPTDYFNTVLYTGNGTAIGSGGLAVTGVGFQSDFTWIKSRSGTEANVLFDAVRGATNILASDSNAAESNNTESLTTWGADGFTLGDKASVNGSGSDFVSWNWKAGTTSGITTDGSTTITPSAYSFNQTAGISILKYTGNTVAGAKLAHGLGVAPDFTIFKSTANGTAWNSYNTGMDATAPEDYSLCLSSTAARDDNASFWNDTPPDSVNITLGSGADANPSALCIAYCFASVKGYSKFGSYRGNVNADGPFIYTGFRPAFIIVKRTDSTANWVLFSSPPTTQNQVSTVALFPNLTSAESTYDEVDFLSNGIKIRDASGTYNTSTATYLYAAFAQSPFVNSNGIPTNAQQAG